MSKFSKFSYHTLYTSDFVHDVMFSHNGANGPEPKAMLSLS